MSPDGVDLVAASGGPEFARALAVVLRHEGGYQNSPTDPGNAAPHGVGGGTNAGVTQATYDAWRVARGLALRPVRQIEPDEVADVYRRGYWRPAKCDVLAQAGRPQLALVHFDAAVNSGVGQAARFLQRAVGLAGADVDGVVGPKTLYRACHTDEPSAVTAYLIDRLGFFERLAAKRGPAFRREWLGVWKARLRSLRHAAGLPPLPDLGEHP